MFSPLDSFWILVFKISITTTLVLAEYCSMRRRKRAISYKCKDSLCVYIDSILPIRLMGVVPYNTNYRRFHSLVAAELYILIVRLTVTVS